MFCELPRFRSFRSLFAVVVAVLLACALALCLAGCQNESDTEPPSSEAPAASNADEAPDASADDGQHCPFTVRLSCVNSWEADGKAVGQYDVSIANGTDKDVSSWELVLEGAEGVAVSDSWNCELEASGTAITLTPASYNAEIAANGSLADIGLILAPRDPLALFQLTVAYADGTNEVFDAAALADPEPVRPPASASAAAGEASSNVPAFSEAGKLHVEGTGLADEQGNPVQLRGVSTHGLAWFPQYVNEAAFATLRNDWGANVVRLAMYTAESGGYCTDGDQAALLDLIDEGVRAATKADLYVIIDWHILSDNDPTMHQAEALEFFDTVAARYAENDNVLYEVCNEPQNSPFASVIKPYAEAALGAIRAHDPDAVVLVGTNTWSQDIDEVIGNQIDDPNVMYTLHFYAATHTDNIREKLTRALDAGVPAFVSECSITDASGNGTIDGDSAAAWLELLNSNNVSFVAWSLSNKNETSALIAPDSQATSGWSDEELSDTGRWFKEAIGNS